MWQRRGAPTPTQIRFHCSAFIIVRHIQIQSSLSHRNPDQSVHLFIYRIYHYTQSQATSHHVPKEGNGKWSPHDREQVWVVRPPIFPSYPSLQASPTPIFLNHKNAAIEFLLLLIAFGPCLDFWKPKINNFSKSETRSRSNLSSWASSTHHWACMNVLRWDFLHCLNSPWINMLSISSTSWCLHQSLNYELYVCASILWLHSGWFSHAEAQQLLNTFDTKC